MARNQSEDLQGYHKEVTICENGIVYNLFYNPSEKDCSKAWKKVAEK